MTRRKILISLVVTAGIIAAGVRSSGTVTSNDDDQNAREQREECRRRVACPLDVEWAMGLFGDRVQQWSR